MLKRALIPALLALSLFPAAAAAKNPWLGIGVMNMAHQGGEDVRPSNTMYALRESLANGSDMLELDVHATKDDRIVVMHDSSVDRTTNGTGSVYDMTLAQVQALDAAYNFVPGENTVKGKPASAYPLRGVRTGAKPAPLGYSAQDFRIPTLDEVLKAFPKVPINVEIKGKSDADTGTFFHNADLLAQLLNKVGRTDIIVVSFKQEAVDRFHKLAPQIPLAPGITGAALFFGSGVSAGEGVVALQVPPSFTGVTIMSKDFVDKSHRAGYAVHVWFSGEEESDRVYNTMLDYGSDGLMAAKPEALEKVLCARHTPRPAGNPNHCGGGRAFAARSCRVRAASAGPIGPGRIATLRLRRTGPLNSSCKGRAFVAGLGSGRFVFPYGISSTIARVKLARGAAGRLASVRARVDGGRLGTARTLRLRATA